MVIIKSHYLLFLLLLMLPCQLVHVLFMLTELPIISLLYC
uniref:Uncharacterized protein n=1 Tax=Rhizophora mucronata TaxID=61149 RepID=A0A2P2NBF4_RHIMU